MFSIFNMDTNKKRKKTRFNNRFGLNQNILHILAVHTLYNKIGEILFDLLYLRKYTFYITYLADS